MKPLINAPHVLGYMRHLVNLGLMKNPDDINSAAKSWAHEIGRCTIEDFDHAGRELIRTWDTQKEWAVNFSHLATKLREVRMLRAAKVRVPTPPAHLAHDPRAEIEWLRTARAAIGDGATTHQAEIIACQATGTQPRPAIEPAPRPIQTRIAALEHHMPRP